MSCTPFRVTENKRREIARNRERSRDIAWKFAHNDEMDVARQLQAKGLTRSEALREADRIVHARPCFERG